MSLKQELVELAADLGDPILDQLLADGLIKDIPVLGWGVKLALTARTISNHMFLKKLKRFLFKLHETTQGERETFVSRLEADQQERQRVGENLILLLDRLNDMRKPEMAAQVCAAYVKGRITVRDMQLLHHALDRLDLEYLPFVEEMYSGPWQRIPDPDALQHLGQCGLARAEWGGGGYGSIGGGGYTHNHLGRLFAEIILFEPPPPPTTH